MWMVDGRGEPLRPHNVHNDNRNGEWECSDAGLIQIAVQNARPGHKASSISRLFDRRLNSRLQPKSPFGVNQRIIPTSPRDIESLARLERLCLNQCL
jgi:hypothetical protein